MDGIKRILAVAVGAPRDHLIAAAGIPGNVRPYVDGLITGWPIRASARDRLRDRLQGTLASRPDERQDVGLFAPKGDALRRDLCHVDQCGAGGQGYSRLHSDRRRCSRSESGRIQPGAQYHRNLGAAQSDCGPVFRTLPGDGSNAQAGPRPSQAGLWTLGSQPEIRQSRRQETRRHRRGRGDQDARRY